MKSRQMGTNWTLRFECGIEGTWSKAWGRSMSAILLDAARQKTRVGPTVDRLKGWMMGIMQGDSRLARNDLQPRQHARRSTCFASGC
jgi:hypothetical protein